MKLKFRVRTLSAVSLAIIFGAAGAVRQACAQHTFKT